MAAISGIDGTGTDDREWPPPEGWLRDNHYVHPRQMLIFAVDDT